MRQFGFCIRASSLSRLRPIQYHFSNQLKRQHPRSHFLISANTRVFVHNRGANIPCTSSSVAITSSLIRKDNVAGGRHALSQPPEVDTAQSSTTRLGHHKVYIALGSNLGDRLQTIEIACREMHARGISITRTSSLYETQPMYVEDQAPFINGVCEVSHLSFSVVPTNRR